MIYRGRELSRARDTFAFQHVPRARLGSRAAYVEEDPRARILHESEAEIGLVKSYDATQRHRVFPACIARTQRADLGSARENWKTALGACFEAGRDARRGCMIEREEHAGQASKDSQDRRY